MNRYSDYVLHLEAAALDNWNDQYIAALDGEPSRELRRLVDLEQRRKAGAFFTGSVLARKAVSGLPPHVGDTFFDAACGAGDLLLAAARLLPARASLEGTLNLWGSCLMGCDIHPEFVRAAKARLVLLAKQLSGHNKGYRVNLKRVFPLIKVADGLIEQESYSRADWILINPPYVAADAPAGCEWSCGNVSSAALFMEKAIQSCRTGTRITAILPDVLRTGARYKKWRSFVSEQTKKLSIRSWGLFDEAADVDVFVLSVTKREHEGNKFSWIPSTPKGCKKVADIFKVHVGPVVPFRLTKKGRKTPFIHAKALPRWAVMDKISETCKFTGTLYRPPFVVVRRTSRPGDPHRAVATIITVPEEIAVENHLLICVPKSGSLQDCQSLMDQLQQEQTSHFLNRRIRCRHLTVAALSELPWLEKKE